MGRGRRPRGRRAAPRAVGGRVVVADATGRVADLFALPPAVTRDTRRVLLYAVRAPKVPRIAVEEALWTAWDLLSA